MEFIDDRRDRTADKYNISGGSKVDQDIILDEDITFVLGSASPDHTDPYPEVGRRLCFSLWRE